jgi:hypothetical protein
MRKAVIIGGVLVMVGCFVGLFSWEIIGKVRGPQREMERVAHSMMGHFEAELLKALGQPRHVVTIAELAGRTVDYPWKGMNFIPVPTRPVRNKVLLYSKLDMAIYVYVDEHGMVEHVAIAGT